MSIALLRSGLQLAARPVVPPAPGPMPALPLLVLNLAGTQAEMGAQHGRLLRDVGGWQPVLDYYPTMVERLAGGTPRGVAERVAPVALRPIIRGLLHRLDRDRPADARARIAAFVQAVGAPSSRAIDLSVMDVLQNLIGMAGRVGAAHIAERAMSAVPPACSTLAIWGAGTDDGRLLHARNFDFPGSGVWEQGPAVVFCTPNDGLRYGFVTTRGADAPVVSVFNEAGISITIHTRFHKLVRFSGATAVDIVHRTVRQARTLAEAIVLLRERPSSSTWGIIVSSAAERSAALVELNARRSAVTFPASDEPFMACTNRYRHADLQAGELEPSPGWLMHSDGRFATLQRRATAAAAGAPMTVEHLQDLLGDHSDADLPGVQRAAGGVLAQSNGVHSVVIDAERQAIDVSVGAVPTGHGPWLRVPWTWRDAPGADEIDLTQLRADHLADRDGDHFHGSRRGPGYRAFLEAARLEMMGADARRVDSALQDAARLDPNETTYALLAAGCSLRNGDLATGSDHLARGCAHEKSAFYRGRLLLWRSRAADGVGDRATAQAARRELQQLDHPMLDRYHRAARAESSAPYSDRRLRRTHVFVQLCDIG